MNKLYNELIKSSKLEGHYSLSNNLSKFIKARSESITTLLKIYSAKELSEMISRDTGVNLNYDNFRKACYRISKIDSNTKPFVIVDNENKVEQALGQDSKPLIEAEEIILTPDSLKKDVQQITTPETELVAFLKDFELSEAVIKRAIKNKITIKELKMNVRKLDELNDQISGNDMLIVAKEIRSYIQSSATKDF